MGDKIHKKIIKSPLRSLPQYATLDSSPPGRNRRWKNRKTLSGQRGEMGGFSLLESIYHIDQSIMLWLQDTVRNPLLSKFLVPLTAIGYAGVLWIILSVVMLFFGKTRKVGCISLQRHPSQRPGSAPASLLRPASAPGYRIQTHQLVFSLRPRLFLLCCRQYLQQGRGISMAERTVLVPGRGHGLLPSLCRRPLPL